jgi:hypothetical protein
MFLSPGKTMSLYHCITLMGKIKEEALPPMVGFLLEISRGADS